MAKKIKVCGAIISNSAKWVYDWFGIDATCPKDVSSVIDAIEDTDPDKDLEVFVSSGGGSVIAGSEIYTLLMMHRSKGKIKGQINFAASAASVIAMAFTESTITPTGQVMIHNASSWAAGNRHSMEQSADMLRSVDEGIANAYILRTGMSQEELLALMDEETWMNAQRAVKLHFVDSVMFDEGNQLVASAELDSVNGMIPEKIIAKMRELQASGSLPSRDSYKDLLSQKGDELMAEITNSTTTQVEQVETVAAADTQQQTESQTTATPVAATLEELIASASPEVRAQFEAMQRQSQENAAELARITDENELEAVRNDLRAHDKLGLVIDQLAPVMRNLKKTDPDGYALVQAAFKAANNQADAGAVFNTTGTQQPAEDGSDAWETVQSRVKALQDKNKSLTMSDALRQVFNEDPKLYQDYVSQTRPNVDEDTDE